MVQASYWMVIPLPIGQYYFSLTIHSNSFIQQANYHEFHI